MHNGLIPDVLEKVTEFSGLEFTYEYTDTYREALNLVIQGKADILGAFLGSEEGWGRHGAGSFKGDMHP